MKKILTIILDGFGMREDIYGNAVKNAGMNNFINIWNNYPHCLLKANEESIGLPKDQSSYSELGHKIIGAGRVVEPTLSYLNDIFKKDKLKYNSKYNEMIKYLQQNKENKLHITILLSNGGVSSSIDHLKNFIKTLQSSKIDNQILLHVISDGRDSNKFSLTKYLNDIKDILNNNIHLASICGRYYALDYTNDYRRTKMYYELLFDSKGVDASNLQLTLNKCYEKKISDEYLPPLKTNQFIPVNNNDVFLFMNFSKENQIQLLNALSNKEFHIKPTNIKIYSLLEINRDLNSNYFFESPKVNHCLCEYLAELGIDQAHIFENIKEKSMTYYLNGEKKVNIKNCDIYSVESPVVDSFDIKPEMNALTVAKTIIDCMDKDYDFIVANFANPDEVGHTGNYQATINGLQAIDVCLGKIIEVAEENFYKIVIVGSHAKADTIIDRQNNIITKNTTSPVPFIIMDKKVKLKNGSLISFAPTLLKYLDIAIPKEMKETDILL